MADLGVVLVMKLTGDVSPAASKISRPTSSVNGQVMTKSLNVKVKFNDIIIKNYIIILLYKSCSAATSSVNINDEVYSTYQNRPSILCPGLLNVLWRHNIEYTSSRDEKLKIQ